MDLTSWYGKILHVNITATPRTKLAVGALEVSGYFSYLCTYRDTAIRI